MKKKACMVVLAAVFCALAQASLVVTDDFDRANTLYNKDASVSIGEHYVLSSLTGDRAGVRIIDNQVGFGLVDGETSPAHAALYRTDLELLSSGGSFTNIVSGDITTHTLAAGNLFYGMVFNVQEDGSFYAARIRTGNTIALQFLRVDGTAGSSSAFANVDAGVELATDSVYNLTITSSVPGVFDYKLTGANLDEGELSGTVSDAVLELEGGYAGFYSSNCNTVPRFDNLYIEVIPEPATLGFLFVGFVGMLIARNRFVR